MEKRYNDFERTDWTSGIDPYPNFSISNLLEIKYGLTSYRVSENRSKYYRKDIGYNKYIKITVSSGLAVDISINKIDTDDILIIIAQRYCPKNDFQLDFLLTGSSRLSQYIQAL